MDAAVERTGMYLQRVLKAYVGESAFSSAFQVGRYSLSSSRLSLATA